MAKSVQSAAPAESTKGRFRVAIKGYPVMGFVDRDRKVHSRLPVETHYRRRAADVDSDVPDGWHTERQLRDSYGLPEVPRDFRRRKRVRMDLTSALFEGAVVAADSEHEARAVFCATYGVKDTLADNWKVRKCGAEEPVGPYGPKKIRGLLDQGDAGDAAAG